MSNTNKLIFWGINAIAIILLILAVIVVTKNMLSPLTMSTQAQPLAKQAEVAPAQPTPASFVVLPGKFVGGFVLGMSKKDVLKTAPKPQEKSTDRLVYKNQKTGNRLIARFQKNRLVQIDFTSKDFYTEEGIHPGNFRDARYATLFDMEKLPGTPLQLKYTLKTGGLIFYSNPDSLSRAVGVVHEGREPIYTVKSITGNASGQEQKSSSNIKAQNKLRETGNNSSSDTPMTREGWDRVCAAAGTMAFEIAQSRDRGVPRAVSMASAEEQVAKASAMKTAKEIADTMRSTVTLIYNHPSLTPTEAQNTIIQMCKDGWKEQETPGRTLRSDNTMKASNYESSANSNDIQQAKKLVSEMPPACQGSQYSVSRDGTITVRILCLGSSAATSIDGSIEIKDGIVKNIR